MQNMWTGRRVRLRGVEPSDWERFHQNDADTEAQRQSDLVYAPRSAEGSRQWAEGQSRRQSGDDSLFLAIETLDGELVGSISTHDCDRRSGTFRYGVAIFRAHWRQGYATEAILLLLRYYFEELRYQKVTTTIYGFNTPSLRLHERLGFQVEGRLRRMLFTQGQFHDHLLVGMTVEEFAERHGARL